MKNKFNTSFVRNQPQFFALGFDPTTEQWKYTVRIGGETFDYSGGLWAFVPQTMTRKPTYQGEKPFTFEPRARIATMLSTHTRASDILKLIKWGRLKISKNWNDADVRLVVSTIGKFNQPKPASIFYSFLSDMDAGEHSSFQDFCDSLGYDNDSIKALETYQACQRSARRFRSVVTKGEIETLREVLQDY